MRTTLVPTTGAEKPAAIRVEGLSKAFGSTAILRGVDLDIRSGELLALLGPSGSGKTTLLRIIAGLERSDSGRLLFDQNDATSLPVQKRAVGFVFQHYALFRHMTVAENVAYGLRAKPRKFRPSNAEISSRVTELLDLVRLGDFAHRYPSQLSGGQRQRVALARALAVRPRVLLLDEPFGALDAQVRKELRRWLRHIHQESGQTTVFVTHDQDEALELADRVAILDHGRLEQIGSPSEVQDAPVSAPVMRFLGETTQVAGMGRDGALFVGGRPVGNVVGQIGSGPLPVFVRPWHFSIRPAREAEPGHLRGAVQDVVRAQGKRRIDVACEDGSVVVVEAPDLQRIPERGPVDLTIETAFVFAPSP